MSRAISVLSEAACEAIAAKVEPLRKGADREQLLEDIQVAAAWYVIRAELPLGKQDVPATLHELRDKLEAAHSALEKLPVEKRVLLHEAAEPDRGPGSRSPLWFWGMPSCAVAWRSPTAAAEAELGRLAPLVRKAAARNPVKRGRKYGRGYPEALKVLLTAWEKAIGRSPFSDEAEPFLAFAGALTEQLKKANYAVDTPSLRQMKTAAKLIKATSRTYGTN